MEDKVQGSIIKMGVDVNLKCTNESCDNRINIGSSNPMSEGKYIKIEKNMRYLCMTCGKDMFVQIEKNYSS
ncbi:hypothetical protein LCGC14_2926730 [marine sediment metagenome]|uniref:Uncharacterized protein n=1 Tax=marine sediment metagenome TaxID=412755 RepID=A0A0F8Y8Y9_9ZZZZ